MKKTFVLSVIILLFMFVFDINADCIINDSTYFPDGRSGLYFVEKDNDGYMTLWNYCQNSKVKVMEGVKNFDSIFYSNGSVYLTENKGRILYIMPMNNKSELAEVSLSNEYIMAVDGDYRYFLDKSDSGKVIKYNSYLGMSEEINLNRNIETIFTDTVGKGVFGIAQDGVIDVDKNNFIECEVPKIPFKCNGSMFTDSDGKVYSFDSQKGFETVLDTGYEKICCIRNDVYALDNGEIYNLDENGGIISVCHPEVYISDIASSGENLYGISDKDAVYIPKSGFVRYRNDESVVSEISEKESSKAEESRNEISVSEPSKIIQKSVVESSVKEYPRVVEKSVIEIVRHDYSISIDKYAVYEDMIFIEQGTTVSELKNGISYGDNKISFTNHNGKSVTSGTVGTGWRIDFSGNGEVKSYYTVVRGDVTGEGNVNTKDIYLMKDYIFGKEEFSKYQIIAGDIKENGIIDSVDIYLMSKENQLI